MTAGIVAHRLPASPSAISRAELQHHYPLADRHHEAHVVLDEQHRHAGVAQAPADRPCSAARSAAMSPAAGSSTEQQPRVGDRRARQFDAPPVAERERPWPACPASGSSAQALERRARPLVASRCRAARRGQREEIAAERRTLGAKRAGMTFSSTVMSPNRRAFWNVRPTPSAAMRCGCQPVTSSAVDRVRGRRRGRPIPPIALKSVVLPAPLGPIRDVERPALECEAHVVDRDETAEALRGAAAPRAARRVAGAAGASRALRQAAPRCGAAPAHRLRHRARIKPNSAARERRDDDEDDEQRRTRPARQFSNWWPLTSMKPIKRRADRSRPKRSPLPPSTTISSRSIESCTPTASGTTSAEERGVTAPRRARRTRPRRRRPGSCSGASGRRSLRPRARRCGSLRRRGRYARAAGSRSAPRRANDQAPREPVRRVPRDAEAHRSARTGYPLIPRRRRAAASRARCR